MDQTALWWKVIVGVKKQTFVPGSSDKLTVHDIVENLAAEQLDISPPLDPNNTAGEWIFDLQSPGGEKLQINDNDASPKSNSKVTICQRWYNFNPKKMSK